MKSTIFVALALLPSSFSTDVLAGGSRSIYKKLQKRQQKKIETFRRIKGGEITVWEYRPSPLRNQLYPDPVIQLFIPEKHDTSCKNDLREKTPAHTQRYEELFDELQIQDSALDDLW